MTDLVLTQDQQNAVDAFTAFLLDNDETVFVLSGYAGTGKTTLVTYLLDITPATLNTIKLLGISTINYCVAVTATTNKAAEVLSETLHTPVSTIHSFLNLIVTKDIRTNESKLVSASNTLKENYILFIDEASFIDSALLSLISSKTHNCKIVFIGDPAQLSPVKSKHVPVFSAGFKGAALTEVVRQAAGNPILDLATRFRETVSTGEFFQFAIDHKTVKHLSGGDFEIAVRNEFTRPDWHHNDSKILAWTNKRVTQYNNFITELLTGNPEIAEGDYVIVNSYVRIEGYSFSTDQVVYITGVVENTSVFGVPGKFVEVNNQVSVFMPDDWHKANKTIAQWRKDEEIHKLLAAEKWIDLRPMFACTVNKSQGSTYDKVFIDLSDISRCNCGNQIARMMYVAVSRARYQVVFTGDFV